MLKIAIWQDLIQRIRVTKLRILDSSDSHSAPCYQRPLNRTSNCFEKCMKNTSEILESSEISLTYSTATRSARELVRTGCKRAEGECRHGHLSVVNSSH